MVGVTTSSMCRDVAKNHWMKEAGKFAISSLTQMVTFNSHRQARQTWPSPLDSLATCLAFSLSPHCLIVLPLTIVRNGGLAFLVLYSLLVLLLGAPLLLLELRLGQYSNLAPGFLYRHLCPILAGLGPTVVLFAAIRFFKRVIFYSQLQFLR